MSTKEAIILVAEDEPALRDVVASFLSHHGYTVLTASDGMEALQLASERDRIIHLLLTDIIMPNLNGLELVRRIKQQRPEIKILYMSGYIEHVLVRQSDEELDIVVKPFTPDKLLAKIRAVLGEQSNQDFV